MKKLINILLFSTICFGANALDQTAPTIWTHGIYNMNVKMKNDKTYHFVNDSITFTACNYHNIGRITIKIEDESRAGYEKIKKMMNEIQGKIKVTPYAEGDGWDKNGIRHFSIKTGAKWNGYTGDFSFQFEDIQEINLY